MILVKKCINNRLMINKNINKLSISIEYNKNIEINDKKKIKQKIIY